ncbi:MAG: response regulator [Candidatus Dormibacteria bacterium]
MPRALIADDDQLIRHLLSASLQSAGYDVVAAGDGIEAMALIDTGTALDIVITDYSMPRATGIEVIEHSMRRDPTVPCIIVTAFRDLELAMRGMNAGAVNFIPKPFSVSQLLSIVGQALERRRLSREVARLSVIAPMLERFTMVLANTLEFKDCATRHHSERLVGSADAVARELGLDDARRVSIRLGACLHDIGKVGVPETILRKHGRLTAEETEAMRLHPDIGAAILGDIDAWEEVRGIVRHHHERVDGGGYPLGLAGDGIPLGARIVAVVDSFDVMCTGRAYAPARSADEARHELLSCRGRQFDPSVVDAFLATLEGPAEYDDIVTMDEELSLVARRTVRSRYRGRAGDLAVGRLSA